MHKLILSTIFFTTVIFSNLSAQKTNSREILEKEKKENLAQISKVKKILNDTQKEKRNSVSEVNAIIEQIENQKKRIELANEDLELIKVEMIALEKAQNDLKIQLKTMTTEYAETLYRTSKNSHKLTKLGFLFSSGSIMEIFMRYKYLEQYTANRKSQLEQITKVSEVLKIRQKTLVQKKIKQNTLIQEISIESKSLGLLKERQNLVIQELTKKESQLREEIAKSRAAVTNLNSLISNIIAKDKNTRRIPASRQEDEKNRLQKEKTKLSSRINKDLGTPVTEPLKVEITKPTTIVSSNKFGSYKYKLSWPVEGFISDKFGVKNHPVLKGLKIDNNGVNIQTGSNAPVKTVFEGVVLDISQIPGLHNVIAIQHGEYYTVYANLANVSVKINENVNINQIIGYAADKDGAGEINFQIWHNFDKINPEPWLSSK